MPGFNGIPCNLLQCILRCRCFIWFIHGTRNSREESKGSLVVAETPKIKGDVVPSTEWKLCGSCRPSVEIDSPRPRTGSATNHPQPSIRINRKVTRERSPKCPADLSFQYRSLDRHASSPTNPSNQLPIEGRCKHERCSQLIQFGRTRKEKDSYATLGIAS